MSIAEARSDLKRRTQFSVSHGASRNGSQRSDLPVVRLLVERYVSVLVVPVLTAVRRARLNHVSAQTSSGFSREKLRFSPHFPIRTRLHRQ